jgi:hypothetical protein
MRNRETRLMHRAGRMAIAGLMMGAAASAILPARAQPPMNAAGYDLTGEWAPRFHEDQPERIPGPEIGDYLGLPINEAARLHADSWDASILTLPEHQCKPRPTMRRAVRQICESGKRSMRRRSS